MAIQEAKKERTLNQNNTYTYIHALIHLRNIYVRKQGGKE